MSNTRSPLQPPANRRWRKRTTSTPRWRANPVSTPRISTSGCAGASVGALRLTVMTTPRGLRQNRRIEQGIGPLALDLDDPEIGVAAALPRDIGIGVGFGHRGGTGRPHPDRRAIGLARLRQHRAPGAAPAQLYEDRAGVPIAVRYHGNPDPGTIAAPDQRLDPDPAFEPGFPVWGGPCYSRDSRSNPPTS